MSDRPEIFISCVSAEFRSVRQAVGNALVSLGYTPVFQEIFATDGGDLRQILRKKIDQCSALIQIVGDAYGAEPPTIDPDYGRVSYTQFEFLYAGLKGKKRIIFFASADCERDATAEILDSPPAWVVGAAALEWQAERRALQTAYRQQREAEEALYYEARSKDHLLLMLHTIRDDLAVLRAEESEWKARVMAALDTMEFGHEVAQEVILERFEEAREQVGQLGVRQEAIHAETKESLRLLAARLDAILAAEPEASTRALLAVDYLGALTATQSAEMELMLREMTVEHGGWELDRMAGIQLIFGRPLHAVLFAVAWLKRVRQFGQRHGVRLEGRAGAHLCELTVRAGPGEVLHGATRVIEVEPEGRRYAAAIRDGAPGGQILLFSSVFEVARRAVPIEAPGPLADAQWVSHGTYRLKNLEYAVELFGVSADGNAPPKAPADSELLRRAVSPGEEALLGWRPSAGAVLPNRQNWRMLSKLGEGGFGEAWLMEQPKTGEKRVLKFCFDPAHLASLKREVTLFRALNDNPRASGLMARVLDWNLDQPPHYIEMSYYELGSLPVFAENSGGMAALPLMTRLRFMARIADALAVAHRQGILHRDIKPSNILIGKDKDGKPEALLSDFGIATLLDRQHLNRRGITATGLTTTGKPASAALGTRLYLAPEILENQPPSVASDVFAFGVTLFQVTVGDLNRALGHGWEDEVAHTELKQLIALCIHRKPAARLDRLDVMAKRLRDIARIGHGLDLTSKSSGTGWSLTAVSPSEERKKESLWGRIVRYYRIASRAADITAKVLLASLLVGILYWAGNAAPSTFWTRDIPSLFTQRAAPSNPVFTPSPSVARVVPTPQPTAEPTPTPTPSPTTVAASERIRIRPDPPIKGEMLTIRYLSDGTPLAYKNEIYLHFGVNGWRRLANPRPRLVRISAGLWLCEVMVGLDVEEVNIAFTDIPTRNDGVWDNNGGASWAFKTGEARGLSLLEAKQASAESINDFGNLSVVMDGTSVRLRGQMVAFAESTTEDMPSYVVLVDKDGNQALISYWTAAASQRLAAGVPLQVGGEYEFIGQKTTYRGGINVVMELGTSMRLLSPPQAGIRWLPPRTTVRKIGTTQVGSLVRVSGIVRRMPGQVVQPRQPWNRSMKQSPESVQRWQLLDPDGTSQFVNFAYAVDFSDGERLAGLVGKVVDIIALHRRSASHGVEILVLMPQNWQAELEAP